MLALQLSMTLPILPHIIISPLTLIRIRMISIAPSSFARLTQIILCVCNAISTAASIRTIIRMMRIARILVVLITLRRASLMLLVLLLLVLSILLLML